jgi:hypothetical protein
LPDAVDHKCMPLPQCPIVPGHDGGTVAAHAREVAANPICCSTHCQNANQFQNVEAEWCERLNKAQTVAQLSVRAAALGWDMQLPLRLHPICGDPALLCAPLML